MARLARAFEERTPSYPPMDLGADLGLDEVQNVVLWVIDGLGDQYLGEQAWTELARDRVRGMTSVFPPTTSAALTSLATGHPPRRHGVTGWFMYVHELGAVTAWLPFGPRVGRGQWARMAPESHALLEREAIWDRFKAEVHVVQPSWLVDTPYSLATTGYRARRHGYQGLDGLANTLLGITSGEPGQRRRFIYAYWPHLDSLSHDQGVYSAETEAHLESIDSTWQALKAGLAGTGTTLLATADHGLVDTAEQRTIYLADHAELADMLALPLCGEPRAAYCYLRPGTEADFQAYVSEHLGDVCAAYRAETLLEAGWYGPPPEHERLRRRIGDWVLLPAEGWVLKDQLLGESPSFSQIGVHGGASAREQRVPLVGSGPL